MYELMRLTGQEYVDEYAGVVKERIAAEKRARVVGEVLGTVERLTGRDTSRLSERLSERLFGDDLSPGDSTFPHGEVDEDDEVDEAEVTPTPDQEPGDPAAQQPDRA